MGAGGYVNGIIDGKQQAKWRWRRGHSATLELEGIEKRDKGRLITSEADLRDANARLVASHSHHCHEGRLN